MDRNSELLERKANILEITDQVSTALNSTLNFNEAVTQILQLSKSIFEAEASIFISFNRIKGKVSTEQVAGCKEIIRFNKKIGKTQFIKEADLSRAKIIDFQDKEWKAFFSDYFGLKKYLSGMLAPLVMKKQIEGYLVIIKITGTEVYNDDHLALLDILTSKLIISINNCYLYRELINYNLTLERQVNLRTNELRTINNRLSEALENLRQAQLLEIQREKMSSLGLLTAGIAHEINNPLAFVINNISILKEKNDQLFRLFFAERLLNKARDKAFLYQELLEFFSDDPEIKRDLTEFQEELSTLEEGKREELREKFFEFFSYKANQETPLALKRDFDRFTEKIQLGLDRVKQIVKELKEYTRGTADNDKELVNLHNCIDSTITILSHIFKEKNIEIVRDYKASSEFLCFPGRINQVFMNLLSNAADASLPRGTVFISSYENKGEIIISFRDQGSGMDIETQKKIFDPFFTTKPPGKGTGLGLTLSYKIVKELDGELGVDSLPGKGTTFTVRLPKELKKI